MPTARMFCYRHPDRETWLRSADATSRSAQVLRAGPVGSRCRQCGLVKNDPLTSFTPRQLLLGLGTARRRRRHHRLRHLVSRHLLDRLGYFAGRIVAETTVRVVGYKRGPVMLSILFGGILIGTVLGFGFQYAQFLGGIPGDYQDALGPCSRPCCPRC